jgi:hypothetical protein
VKAKEGCACNPLNICYSIAFDNQKVVLQNLWLKQGFLSGAGILRRKKSD